MSSFEIDPTAWNRHEDLSTWFLVPRPNFFMGFGSVLGLFGGLFQYNVSKAPPDADAHAIYADWRIVGQDLRDALVSYDSEN